MKDIIAKRLERTRQFVVDMAPVVRGFVRDVLQSIGENSNIPDFIEVDLSTLTGPIVERIDDNLERIRLEGQVRGLSADQAQALREALEVYRTVKGRYDPGFDEWGQPGDKELLEKATQIAVNIFGPDVNMSELDEVSSK